MCKRYFTNLLLHEIKNKFSKVNIKELVKKPVEGAIVLELEKLDDKSFSLLIK